MIIIVDFDTIFNYSCKNHRRLYICKQTGTQSPHHAYTLDNVCILLSLYKYPPVYMDIHHVHICSDLYPISDNVSINETRNIERITYILHLSAQQQNSILNNNISRISPAHINQRTKYVQYWRINIIYTPATPCDN